MRKVLVVLALGLPMVASAGFRASSQKPEGRGTPSFAASSALDSDPSTCWQVDPEADNEGSWFEIDVPKSTVDKVAAIVGWAKDAEMFADYPRLKTLKVEVIDEAKDGAVVLEHSVTFEDKQEWQVIDLPDTAVGNELYGGKVRLTVKEVYKGQDYPNLAVSELLVHLAEIDTPAMVVTPPSSSAPGHAASSLADGDARTFWASSGSGTGLSFELEATGFGVSSVGLQAGPKNYNRPKTISVFANEQTRTYEMADAPGMQWFPIPPLVGYTGSGFGNVTVTIVDTYPGTDAGVAISEADLKATSYDGL